MDKPSTLPLDGDQDRSRGLLATTLLVTSLAIILVTLRMMVRIWIVKKVGWDDWTIILAAVLSCSPVISCGRLNKRHSWDTRSDQGWSLHRSRGVLEDMRSSSARMNSESVRSFPTVNGFRWISAHQAAKIDPLISRFRHLPL